MFRIGYGNDVHRLEEGRPLVLGGVEIASDLGSVGHSDADALTHAVTDAILGALAVGDIGSHFPDSDPQWKGADSFAFLAHAVELASERGFSISNIDSTIELEKPRLRPHIDEMRSKIADAVGIPTEHVSVKAKTGEGVDAVGRREAVRATAVVLLSSDPI